MLPLSPQYDAAGRDKPENGPHRHVPVLRQADMHAVGLPGPLHTEREADGRVRAAHELGAVSRGAPSGGRSGQVKAFARVDVGELAAWIGAIPFEDWPQQHRLEDGGIRPAMVTDIEWHGFGERVLDVVERLANEAGGDPRRSLRPMLSVVMPGHSIPPHCDAQPIRAHVPLLTNDRAVFVTGGVRHHLDVGCAYLIDPREEHSIANEGETPRVHLIFDVGRR